MNVIVIEIIVVVFEIYIVFCKDWIKVGVVKYLLKFDKLMKILFLL